MHHIHQQMLSVKQCYPSTYPATCHSGIITHYRDLLLSCPAQLSVSTTVVFNVEDETSRKYFVLNLITSSHEFIPSKIFTSYIHVMWDSWLKYLMRNISNLQTAVQHHSKMKNGCYITNSKGMVTCSLRTLYF